MAKLDEFQEDLLQRAKDIENNYRDLKKLINKSAKSYAQKSVNIATKASRLNEMLYELLSDDMFLEAVKTSMGKDGEAYIKYLTDISNDLEKIENENDIYAGY